MSSKKIRLQVLLNPLVPVVRFNGRLHTALYGTQDVYFLLIYSITYDFLSLCC